jgi:hypothetical protein
MSAFGGRHIELTRHPAPKGAALHNHRQRPTRRRWLRDRSRSRLQIREPMRYVTAIPTTAIPTTAIPTTTTTVR